MKKRMVSLALALGMACSLAVPALAAQDVEVIRICNYTGREGNHFSEGFAAIRYGHDDAGFIDKTGRSVFRKFSRTESFHEGLAAVAIGKYPNHTWGYINKRGETVIPLEYDTADSFSEGLAAVGKYIDEGRHEMQRAVIDKTGKVVVPFGKYKSISAFSNGRAVVSVGDSGHSKYGAIDKTGREVVPCKYDILCDFYDGWALVKNYKPGKPGEIGEYGYVSENGEEMLFGKYSYISDFHDGMASVYAEGDESQPDDGYIHFESLKCGFIDTTGREVIPCQYHTYGNVKFSEGLAAVNVGNNYQYIDKTGKVVLSGSNAFACDFSDGLAVLYDEKNERACVIDKTGKVVIPYKYDFIQDFHEGFAVVSTPEVYGYGLVDKTGREVLPCSEYIRNNFPSYMGEFEEKLMVVNGYFKAYNNTDDCQYYRISTPDIAYPSTQTVDVDGSPVEFQCYALKDANGNLTNYVKLRDVADALNGSAAQFEVGYNGLVNMETGKSYTRNGSEGSTPFAGERTCLPTVQQVNIDGELPWLEAFTLTDDAGGGYTYYQLRDLGTALGFKVDWTAERGVFIETK